MGRTNRTDLSAGWFRIAIAAVCASAVVAMALWPSGTFAGGSGLPGFEVSVSKSGTGHGTVTSSPAGIDCGVICASSFDFGAPVELTAVADPGSKFVGWTGACTGSGSCPVPAPSDGRPVSVDAAFETVAAPPVDPPVVETPKPTVSLVGKPGPRSVKILLGCGSEQPCTLQVTALLAIWAGKKGYEYYQARKGNWNIKENNKRTVNLQAGDTGRKIRASMEKYEAKFGSKAVRKLVIRVVDTGSGEGTAMAINEKGLCGCPASKDPNLKKPTK